jgi:predicted Zn-dependent protease
LEQYTGPVLFEPRASASVFESLLGDRLCARPTPLGGGSEDNSFEKKIGLRILPRSFQVYDDPGPKAFETTVLAGAYRYDDEAVPVSHVSLVEKGILKTLVAGRAPTKKVKQSTGHARGPGFGDPRATIGCLYISADDGLSAEELKQELIQTARDEGLEFGLRVAAIEDGQSGSLGDPIYAYKVNVADGGEELVRGMQFRPVEPQSMKRILAAGKDRRAYNSVSGISASVIAPAVVFEELELTKPETEFDKLPILQSPATRKDTPE